MQEINELAERIKDILTVRGNNASWEIVKCKHEVGKEIVEDPAFKKGSHGQGEFYRELGSRLALSERSLQMCVSFVEKYPVWESVEQLSTGQARLSWNSIVPLLGSPADKEKVKSATACEHCPLHCVK